MAFFITGVAGFIGSSLAKKLCDQGKTVIGIDSLICGYESNLSWVKPHHKFTFIKKSIERIDLDRLIEKDQIVIHLSCISSLPVNQEDPAFSYTNNVSSTAELLEVCRFKGVKQVIFASSSVVYENTSIFPTHENVPIEPNLIYSLVKKHCEELVRSFHDIYGLPFSTLRFFNVYGSNQDYQRKHPALIPYILDCFKNRTYPILHSDGKQKRDYVYLDDLIELIEKVIESPINTEINVCSGETISVEAIVKTIQNVMNVHDIEPIYREPSLLWEKYPRLWTGEYTFSKHRMIEEVTKYCLGDPSKTEQLLNWKATTSLEEGIRKIYTSV
jgi:nucleoside-diphosphate-sugar epimerase